MLLRNMDHAAMQHRPRGAGGDLREGYCGNTSTMATPVVLAAPETTAV